VKSPQRSSDQIAERIRREVIFGAFVDGRLCAIATFLQQASPRVCRLCGENSETAEMLTQCPRRSELLVFERQLEDIPTTSSTTHFSKASGLKPWNEAHEAIARRTWIDRVCFHDRSAAGATFHDVPHFAGGIVPGDGIFTMWSYRAGAGRAEAFLLNPQPLRAQTAHEWGVIAEVVPNGKALARARELAKLYLQAPEVTRRNRAYISFNR
jgi:Enoyl-CoA hydratase/isomerase